VDHGFLQNKILGRSVLMKKFSILAGIIAGIAGAFAQGEYTYSPAYIQHLKNCSHYTDEYSVELPTGDETSPYLKIKSIEEILGRLNGKCITKSTIYSIDLNNKIMVIKCWLSKEQVNSIMDKMKAVNNSGDINSRKILSDEMEHIIEDGTTCKVKNYLNE
jgi:hypothetical protein